MNKIKILGGTVHTVPKTVSESLQSRLQLIAIWNDLTPLARNEWICWITSAKKQETRDKRLRIAKENLLEGKRRPCCWPGCPHREKNGS